MLDPRDEFATAIKELQQVAQTVNQGADYFESQAKQGQPIASVTENIKGYIREVLQATTQHLLNVADLIDGTIVDQTAAVGQLDTACSNMLESMLAAQAKTETQYLSALQTPVHFQMFPKTYNPAGAQVLC